jgi:hypothetical protein
MTGIEALRTRHPRPISHVDAAPSPPEEPADSVPRLAAPVVSVIEAAAPRSTVARNPRAMASIHGRVLGQDTADLAVTVGDAQRRTEAAVDDGTFQMKLPPGSYLVVARAGDEVAEAQVDDLAEDEDREVVLVLAHGAAIEGRLEGCDGSCGKISISAQSAGVDSGSSSTASNSNGAFVLGGLLPGHKYDVVFQGGAPRRLVMRGLVAPQRDLVVALEPPPKLSGGFGVEPEEGCPMTSVSFMQKGELELFASFDRHCNFHFDDVPDVDSVHLRAVGTGWRFEVDVPIPAHGDPPFLCLRAPCAESAAEAEATLQIVFSGSVAGRVGIWMSSSVGGVSTACFPESRPCVLSGLAPVTGAKLTVDSDQCQSETLTVDLRPGTNTIPFHCQPPRRIRGMLRSQGELASAFPGRVRCSSGHPPQAAHDGLFALACPASQSTIEYQLDLNQPWKVLALPSGGADNVAFVDISVD